MKNFNKVALTLAVYISRFGFLPANISPLGSFGFFGGNLVFYLLVIVGFDIFKGGFYPGFLFTYLGFFAYWLFGKFAKSQKSKIVLLPAASFTFFLVSNFGVWWHWYPHTFSGLLTCYALAIPFYKNTLLGDLLFGYGFLGVKAVQKMVREYKMTTTQLHYTPRRP